MEVMEKRKLRITHWVRDKERVGPTWFPHRNLDVAMYVKRGRGEALLIYVAPQKLKMKYEFQRATNDGAITLSGSWTSAVPHLYFWAIFGEGCFHLLSAHVSRKKICTPDDWVCPLPWPNVQDHRHYGQVCMNSFAGKGDFGISIEQTARRVVLAYFGTPFSLDLSTAHHYPKPQLKRFRGLVFQKWQKMTKHYGLRRIANFRWPRQYEIMDPVRHNAFFQNTHI